MDSALCRVRRRGEQGAEGQHLAEHAGGLGERQRRRRHQRAVGSRQHLVDAVAEFVRERHDIARLAEVIEKHIGMRGGRRRMSEGAGRLAGPHRRVDPSLVEEAAGDVGHARRKASIGAEDGVARLIPGEDAGSGPGERRVAIPMVELVLAEPTRL